MSKGLCMLDKATCQGLRSSQAYRQQKERHAPTSPNITQTHTNKQTVSPYIEDMLQQTHKTTEVDHEVDLTFVVIYFKLL